MIKTGKYKLVLILATVISVVSILYTNPYYYRQTPETYYYTQKDIYISRMYYWTVTADLGYSQDDRWNITENGNCDCSSLVIYVLNEAGYDTGNATYTGNLSLELEKRGWKRIPPDGKPQPGDILLNDTYHVAIMLYDNQIGQASFSETETETGEPGDQTGLETNVGEYHDYPWNCYLRPPDD